MRYLFTILLFIATEACAQIEMFHAHNFVSQQNLFLDDYPSSHGAYSLRKLSSSYSGNCILVRRSSDNTTQAIGFSNNVLDTAALKSFVGTSTSDTGYVHTWYDQSGNSRNWTQTTNASQPRIVRGGVISRENGFPSIDFGSFTDAWWLESPSSFLQNFTALTYIQVARIDQPPGSEIGFPISNSTGNTGFEIIVIRASYDGGAVRLNGTIRSSSGGSNRWFSEINVFSYSMFFGDNSRIYLYRKGTEVSSYDQSAMPTLTFSGTYRFGRYSSPTYPQKMEMSEIIFYSTSQFSNRVGMQTNISNFYSF